MTEGADRVTRSRIDTGSGAGGLPRLVIANAFADAEIYLHGAQVTSWRPRGHEDVLWLSPRSIFRADKAMRGGVPICFPWFSAHPTDATQPSHGFARLSDWRVARSEELTDGRTAIELVLEADVATRARWPVEFRARYLVTVGATLELALTVENRSDQPISFTEALHAYFAVGDVARCTVLGLSGCAYLDSARGGEPARQSESELTFQEETDRIYTGTESACVIVDPLRKRRITIAKSGSRETVVWNPWTARAAQLADLGADAWPGMLCVETANAGPDRVVVAAGASQTMRAVISVEATG